MKLNTLADSILLDEIGRRFEEKNASLRDMEEMTKKLIELNRRTQESEAIKSRFLSLIRNEFNNPLSSLLNFATHFQQTLSEPKERQIAQMMVHELKQIDFALNNILAATEIESGNVACEYTQIDVRALLDEVVEYFHFLQEEKGLKVIVESDSEVKAVSDAAKLHLIFRNLISNAMEYAFEGTSIRLVLVCNEDTLKLSVTDTGETIRMDDKSDKKALYQRFSKSGSGKTRRSIGLGLGLSVVQAMVEVLEGTIDYDSKNDQTCFIVEVPNMAGKLDTTTQSLGAYQLLFSPTESEKEF